ncbi:prepilin-type N-terminal cleavage/methylation domain-containing protein [Hydrogenivirga sp.]
MSRGRAFTLIEVLVVLTLLGLTFSILLLVFTRGVDSSLNLSGSSEALRLKASLFWDMQRKLLGARRIRVEDDSIFMVTTGGSFSEGVVKCAYIYRDGRLYYYEFPYPYGAINEIDEDRLYELGRLDSFTITVREGNREFKTYDGLPQFVEVKVDDESFFFELIR